MFGHREPPQSERHHRADQLAHRVVCDVYHIFWNANVAHEIACAGTSICGLHLSDWLILSAVKVVGYHGDVEIQILNERAWRDANLDTWLDMAVTRYQAIGMSSSP